MISWTLIVLHAGRGAASGIHFFRLACNLLMVVYMNDRKWPEMDRKFHKMDIF